MTEYLASLNSRLVPESEYEYAKSLSLAYERATKQLQATKGKYTANRLKTVINSIEKELKSLNLDFIKEFKEELPQLTVLDNMATAEEYTYVLQSQGLPVTLFAIDEKRVKAIIKTDHLLFSYKTADGKTHKSVIGVGSMLQSSSVKTAEKVKGIITAGFLVGDHPDKIARDIKRDFLTVQKSYVRTNVRTLMAEASQTAQSEFYKENEENVERWKYVATLDTKTTTICRSLDGRNWNEYPPAQYVPALHPNCRSRLIGIPYGYEPQERPVNLMTAADKKKARAMQKEYLKHPKGSDERKKGQKEREAFLKTKIFTQKANLTYKEAIEIYKPLKESGLIRRDNYVRKLALEDSSKVSF